MLPPASFTFHQCSCESSMTSYSAFYGKRKWSGSVALLIRIFITFSKDKSPVSIALNGYSATTIFNRPDTSWKFQKQASVLLHYNYTSSVTLTVELGVPGATTTAVPGIGMLMSLLMCWPLPFNGDDLKLDNDVLKEMWKHCNDQQANSRDFDLLTCCGELKVGVIFPKLTELFSKWCDCWGEDDEVCSCKGVCGETGWMIWPLLLLLLLFAVFGLMLRVEFWAGELLPLPAIEKRGMKVINNRAWSRYFWVQGKIPIQIHYKAIPRGSLASSSMIFHRNPNIIHLSLSYEWQLYIPVFPKNRMNGRWTREGAAVNEDNHHLPRSGFMGSDQKHFWNSIHDPFASHSSQN